MNEANPMMHYATMADVQPLLPLLLLLGGAFALLMLDLFIADRQRVLVQGGAIAVLAATALMTAFGVGGEGTVFADAYVRDTLSNVANTAILAVSMLSVGYAWSYLRSRGLYQGEVVILMLFAVAGMMIMASAGNLIMAYLGLEMLALSSYALVAIDRDNPRAAEAAMKYFVLGSLASGLLLYGLSLVYGATQSLDLTAIHAALAGGEVTGLLLLGMVFMVAGIAFKFGAAPFHMWLPDTYQGAPTAITLFIGAAPKIAAFVFAWRLLVAGIGPLGDYWQWLIAGLAAISLVVGNFMALMQTNLKRMLAYSTVSHVGFLLMGLTGGMASGHAAALFYAISYALMAAAAFGALVALSARGVDIDTLDDVRGLSKRHGGLAFGMLLIMASLAGLPILIGFWAKLGVLRAAVQAGHLWLAITGIVCAVIGAFYYLRVIKLMYLDAPPADATRPQVPTGLYAMVLANAWLLLVLGAFWSPLMAWCQRAFAI